MLETLKTENIISDQNVISGEIAAKYFKYYSQYNDSSEKRDRILPLSKVAAKGFYQKNKEQFDELILLLKERNIDPVLYIDFLVRVLKNNNYTINDQLLNKLNIEKYFTYRQEIEKYDKIYKYFMKSVKNIADDCKNLQIHSTKDYFSHIVREKKLAQYYMSGKISGYYLAAIPKMKILITKLDNISRDELNHLYVNFEKYNFDINSAFMKIRNIKVNPFKFTDQFI